MNTNTLIAVLMAMLSSEGEMLPDGGWLRAELLGETAGDPVRFVWSGEPRPLRRYRVRSMPGPAQTGRHTRAPAAIVCHAPGMTRELYISVDVEPDGHVPGPSSIVSLGACAAAGASAASRRS